MTYCPRKPGSDVRKYPELAALQTGESILVKPDTNPKNWYANFYLMAKVYGIRLSVNRIDYKTVRLSRIEP